MGYNNSAAVTLSNKNAMLKIIFALLIALPLSAQYTPSAFCTSQPLLGWWEVSFTGYSLMLCGQPRGEQLPCKLKSDGKELTFEFGDQIVVFPVIKTEDYGSRKVALLQNDDCTLMVQFIHHGLYNIQFERPGQDVVTNTWTHR